MWKGKHASSSSSSRTPIDRPGLVNLGSTCCGSRPSLTPNGIRELRTARADLNSTLQCLATLEGLQTMLPDADAPSASAPFSSPSLQALLENPYPGDLPITAALASVLRKLWHQRGGTVNPREMTKSFARKSDVYADVHEQQDVQEAFSFLTSCICMEEVDVRPARRQCGLQSAL
jgi:ubiquitin C-terminal hydrolase